MAKKKEPVEAVKTNGDSDSPIEVLVLNSPGERYPIVRQAVDWAYVLKTRQEFQHLRRNELLELALADVLAQRVTPKKIAEELEEVRKQTISKAEEVEAKPKLKLKETNNDSEKEETEKKKSK